MPRLSPTTLRHNMRCSVIDGTFYMVMAGFAEMFFPFFILEFFGNQVASGLIVTIPLFLASVLQVLSPAMVRAAKSYRKVIVLCAAVQAIACPLLAMIAFLGDAPLWLVFIVAAMYHFGAIVGGPPWTALMGILVPAQLRSSFFAKRLRTLQLGAICAVVAGAALLDNARPIGAFLARHVPWTNDFGSRPTLTAFGLLFLLAGVARMVSTIYLARHIEPPNPTESHRVLSPSQLVTRLKHAGRWRLIAAIVFFWFCAMIGSPFWAAYIRDIAHLTFLKWAALIVLWYLGRALAVTLVADLAKRHGKRWLLIASALFMAPIPALWAISIDPVWLAVAQLLAGMSIGMWELSTFLVTLDTFDEEERTSLLSKYSLLQWGASTAGSSFGGLGIDVLGKGRTAFVAVFLVSSAMRFLATLLLSRTHRSGLPVGAEPAPRRMD